MVKNHQWSLIFILLLGMLYLRSLHSGILISKDKVQSLQQQQAPSSITTRPAKSKAPKATQLLTLHPEVHETGKPKRKLAAEESCQELHAIIHSSTTLYQSSSALFAVQLVAMFANGTDAMHLRRDMNRVAVAFGGAPSSGNTNHHHESMLFLLAPIFNSKPALLCYMSDSLSAAAEVVLRKYNRCRGTRLATIHAPSISTLQSQEIDFLFITSYATALAILEGRLDFCKKRILVYQLDATYLEWSAFRSEVPKVISAKTAHEWTVEHKFDDEIQILTFRRRNVEEASIPVPPYSWASVPGLMVSSRAADAALGIKNEYHGGDGNGVQHKLERSFVFDAPTVKQATLRSKDGTLRIQTDAEFKDMPFVVRKYGGELLFFVTAQLAYRSIKTEDKLEQQYQKDNSQAAALLQEISNRLRMENFWQRRKFDDLLVRVKKGEQLNSTEEEMLNEKDQIAGQFIREEQLLHVKASLAAQVRKKAYTEQRALIYSRLHGVAADGSAIEKDESADSGSIMVPLRGMLDQFHQNTVEECIQRVAVFFGIASHGGLDEKNTFGLCRGATRNAPEGPMTTNAHYIPDGHHVLSGKPNLPLQLAQQYITAAVMGHGTPLLSPFVMYTAALLHSALHVTVIDCHPLLILTALYSRILHVNPQKVKPFAIVNALQCGLGAFKHEFPPATHLVKEMEDSLPPVSDVVLLHESSLVRIPNWINPAPSRMSNNEPLSGGVEDPQQTTAVQRPFSFNAKSHIIILGALSSAGAGYNPGPLWKLSFISLDGVGLSVWTHLNRSAIL